ncbi:MAG: VTT domain-containing protein, partial [Proteobacteria bacterium]|nr:VTT domain-containing protein [Pseudomonadota bacterium]
GNPYLERNAGKRGKQVLAFIGRHGFPAVVLLRICPAMSCELVSLAGGLAAMPPRTYLGASFVGMLPGSILYAAFGSSLVQKDDAWVTVTTVALFAALSLGTVVWLRRIWRREASEAPATADSV